MKTLYYRMDHTLTCTSWWKLRVDENDTIINAEYYTKDPLDYYPRTWQRVYWWDTKRNLKRFLKADKYTRLIKINKKQLFVDLL